MSSTDPRRSGPHRRSSPSGAGRHVIVVADGDVGTRAELDAAWPGWSEGAGPVIAADGGLARAEAAGLAPAVLVGDLDSLDPGQAARAAAAGILVRRSQPDKDESDAELALLEAVALGATRITLLGAFGGPRLDHALANVWLLAHPALEGIDLVLLGPEARACLVAGPGPDGRPASRDLPGRVGATVTLLPFGGDVDGVSTRGLRYPLDDEPLVVGPARGLSNVRVDPGASVTVRRGRLLVVETANRGGGLSSDA